MTMLRTMLSISFMFLMINVAAAIFAQALPAGTVATGEGGLTGLQQTFALHSVDNNTSISETSNTGFVIDAARAVSSLNTIISIFFGGYTLANLFNLPASVANVVNIVEGFIYVVTLFLFFSGRGD